MTTAKLFGVALLSLLLVSCSQQDESQREDINLNELTISQIHDSFREGHYTSEELTMAYLKRIENLDRQTGLNSIVQINSSAIADAKALDNEFHSTGILRPLHGIPMIVKDNYNTIGLQTAAGSVALRGFMPSSDAYQVRKLKEAGAIVIAKSNMAEWAFSPRHTESSIAGTTRNPYNLEYVPAGSSGGTAASVAANFGTIGLGTDTGNSIRGPSSHNALVGFRSTLGLTSREGIVPLYLRNDVGGPMCRTVEDATRVLEIIAGYDPNDEITKYSQGNVPQGYLQYLDTSAIKGMRIGVLRVLSDADPHPEVKKLFEQAINDLEKMGAEIIDPFTVPDFDSLRQNQWCSEFRADIESYLSEYVKWDSLKSIDDIVSYGGSSAYAKSGLEYMSENSGREKDIGIPCGNAYEDEHRIAFRKTIEDAMDRNAVDVFIYPSWNHPPSLLEDYMDGYKGDNSQVISPHTGQPAFSIPMGFTSGNLPAGLQIMGRMYDEPKLLKVAYAYEQNTLHRKPPDLK